MSVGEVVQAVETSYRLRIADCDLSLLWFVTQGMDWGEINEEVTMRTLNVRCGDAICL